VLTADLVRARRKGDELVIASLRGETRRRALELACAYLGMAEDAVGATRGELEERWDELAVGAREQKLAAGLRKLVADRCTFEVDAGVDPPALRADVFTRAAAARLALPEGMHLDREALIDEVAAVWERTPEEIERLLYADLKSSHRLLALEAIAPEALVEAYDLGQAQAALLRAEEVTVVVRCASPGAYRQLFRKMKFLRLLHVIDPLPDGRYRITIDGPFSMFTSVTKYGLSLALLLPTLREQDRFELEATVRWGKERRRLRFRTEGGVAGASDAASEPFLPDEVADLLARFEQTPGRWRAAPCAELLPLPGVGVCVPDLVFHHAETGEIVYLEVLGYWSRAAVWKRVELVEKGLRTPVLFAVPDRLRVSEEVLGDSLPGALYVYKGVMRRKAIEERLDGLVIR